MSDPRVAELRATVAYWRSTYDRLSLDGASFWEWRRVQFESRRALILVQRELIELHAGMVSRIKRDRPVERRTALLRAAHDQWTALRDVVAVIDAACP